MDPGFVIADNGKERITKAGNVDITARDEAGATVVIELKAGTAQPQALTQLLAYMGAIGEEQGSSPHGILIAEEFHPKLLFAAKAVPTVKLLRYGFSFKFQAL